MSDKTKDVGFRSPTNQPSSKRGNNYLLAIGIDAYYHCPTLYNAVKDAQDIVAVLKRRFQFEVDYIQEFYDNDATKANIYKAFNDLADKVTSKDNLIIYFSGHGEFDKIAKRGHWVPVDARKGEYHEYIPNTDVKSYLDVILSHHTFLMVDSCFAGALFSDNGIRNVNRREIDSSRWALTSGRNEIVTDGQARKNSPFARSVLKLLNETNVSLGVAKLCDKVLELVAANELQTPRGEPLQVKGHKGGQFVFHLKKNEVAGWKLSLIHI